MSISEHQKTILIAASVAGEIEYIRKKMKGASPVRTRFHEGIQGTVSGHLVTLVVTKPGLVNTAMALSAMVEQEQPKMIIQTGCAGAFPNSGINIGGIAIATSDIDIHLGVESCLSSTGVPVDPLPFSIIHQDHSETQIPTDKALSNEAFLILQKSGTPVQGPFITVSTLTASSQRSEALYAAYKPCMESMEGAAAAQVSFVYQIPFLEIRSASNMVGERNKANWNLELAFRRSQEAVLEFLANYDRSHNELSSQKRLKTNCSHTN